MENRQNRRRTNETTRKASSKRQRRIRRTTIPQQSRRSYTSRQRIPREEHAEGGLALSSSESPRKDVSYKDLLDITTLLHDLMKTASKATKKKKEASNA